MNLCFWGLYLLTFIRLLSDACLLNGHIFTSWKWSMKQRQQQQEWPSEKKAPDLILFLPVLREQELLEGTLQALRDLPYPGSKHISIVTTEREIAENEGEESGTTVEIAKMLIAGLQQHSSLYSHIHFPSVRGNKATQLNYAYDRMMEGRGDLSTLYIGVYDGDSRPAPKTLLHLLDLIAREEAKGRPWPIALQQPALFLKNFQSISWYLKMEALFQTRWVLGHELRTLRASIHPTSSRNAPYAYCVGHGMFIRADFLRDTGGFPEPSEDVPLGHRLTFLGIPIHPLPVYDVCDVAPRISTLVRQSGFWFCNSLLIWREYHQMCQLNKPLRKGRSIILLLKGTMDCFSWLHYPLHLLSLAFLLAHGLPLLCVLASAFASYLDAGLGIALMLFLFPDIFVVALHQRGSVPFELKIWLILCAPLRNVVRGFAPLLASWYLIQRVCLKQVNIYPKTTR